MMACHGAFAWWAGYCSKFAYLGLQELVIIRGHIIFKLTLVPSPGLVKHGKALPKKSTEYFPTSSWEQVPSSSPSGIPSISWLTPRYLPHQALHLPATCSLIVECYDAMGSMPWLHCIQPHSGATGTHWHTGANAMPMSHRLDWRTPEKDKEHLGEHQIISGSCWFEADIFCPSYSRYPSYGMSRRRIFTWIDCQGNRLSKTFMTESIKQDTQN